MESYVEVSMLHNTATILLSFLMASYACVQPLPIRKMLVYALALSIPGCLLFFPRLLAVSGAGGSRLFFLAVSFLCQKLDDDAGNPHTLVHDILCVLSGWFS